MFVVEDFNGGDLVNLWSSSLQIKLCSSMACGHVVIRRKGAGGAFPKN